MEAVDCPCEFMRVTFLCAQQIVGVPLGSTRANARESTQLIDER